MKESNLVNKNRGNVLIGGLVCVAITGISAVLGSYLGELGGYMTGNTLDMMPVLNSIGPYIAERAGILESMNRVNINEDLLQTTGTLVGALYGGYAPWKALSLLLDLT